MSRGASGALATFAATIHAVGMCMHLVYVITNLCAVYCVLCTVHLCSLGFFERRPALIREDLLSGFHHSQ